MDLFSLEILLALAMLILLQAVLGVELVPVRYQKKILAMKHAEIEGGAIGVATVVGR